jgi:hypothetical protein
MPSTRNRCLGRSILGFAGVLAVAGCYHTLVDTSDYAQGPAPLRMPSPAKDNCCYEDSLTGGRVFEMYCSYCHNAPTLAERPFAHFRNVAAHMRVRANLTGKEYAKVMEFLRRWHDVGGNHPPVEPSPKRLIFSQPISELRGEAGKAGAQGAGQAAGKDGAAPAGQPKMDTPRPEE